MARSAVILEHRGEKHGDAMLVGVDPVDGDLVVDRDQPLSVAAVEGRAQIGERLAVTGIAGAGMAEGGDPALAVALRIGAIVPGVQVEDGGAAGGGMEQLLFLIGHGHCASQPLSQ